MKIEDSLIKTIAEPNLEIAQDLLELGLEEFSRNDAVTKLPVVGSFVAFGKTALAVRDWLFVKNILAFLKGLDEVSPKERQEWVIKLKGDKFQKKVGEEILSIIDKLKDIKKNEIAGRIFAAYIQGVISYPKVIDLTEKLDRLFTSDLQNLKTGLPNQTEDKERFLSIGLYFRDRSTGQLSGNRAFISSNELSPNKDCQFLVNLIRKI
jgi:hypothetical protein